MFFKHGENCRALEPDWMRSFLEGEGLTVLYLKVPGVILNFAKSESSFIHVLHGM